jgi:hypothetical protein
MIDAAENDLRHDHLGWTARVGVTGLPHPGYR